jgi:hypothetical protein
MASSLLQELRTTLAQGARNTMGLGAYVFGAATGLPYARLLGLRSAAERALWREDLDDAESLARELLSLAERYRADWYYGNAIHHGHSLLGRVELKRNRLGPAIEHLHEAGKTPGSPQLNSFGPNMVLAQELLELGEKEAVLKYCELCRAFWSAQASITLWGYHPLDGWTKAIEEGDRPDFGPNLVY